MSTQAGNLAEELFAGAGEMGALMRALDWSKTALGSVEHWPQSLITSISICLNSRFAIFVSWGPQLVMLYNDAARPVIGKMHPATLGGNCREVWPEIWGIISPMLSQVMQQGEATWADNLLLPLERYGYAEECYFTLSYSPIRDEFGGVGGVFIPVSETTEQVIGQRRLRTLRDLAASKGCKSKNARQACAAAARVLSANPYDLPIAAISCSIRMTGNAPRRAWQRTQRHKQVRQRFPGKSIFGPNAGNRSSRPFTGRLARLN
jgi:hypothetical protein